MKIALIYICAFFLFVMGCANLPQMTPEEIAKSDAQGLPSVETKPSRIALYWENTTAPHPERIPWSDALISAFKADLATFSKATDITYFCPKFKSLDETGKLKALGEFWVAVANFESGYKKTSASVDVGKPDQKDTWSVGLYQMSVVDQKNYGLNFGYTYDDLLNPLPNIKLALAILKRQIEKRGVLAIPAPNPGLYWAVLRPGGKYDKSALIAERVKKYAPKCN